MKINRSLCSICGKIPSLSFCTGCQRVFCIDHAEQHRLELSSLLDKIIVDHNQCKQTLIQYTEELNNHPLIKQITDWESQSMERIRQVANDARKQVFNAFEQFANNAIGMMKNLTEVLTKAQEEENFLERDLRQWMETLGQLKKELDKPPTINVRKAGPELPFISKILVSVSEIFEKSAGRIAIKDEGKLIVNTGANGYGTARSKGDYSTGKHRFRLRIEPTIGQKWNFIGIVSAGIPIQATPFNTPTSFGWISNNFVCLNGKLHGDYNGYESEMEKNDTIELVLDCQQRKIRLTNERTNHSHELLIDANLCPLPWQIQLGLYYSKDRIRLLWK